MAIFTEQDLLSTELSVLNALRLKKARAFFLFLLAEPGHAHRSEKIMDMLWQEVSLAKASASLRQVTRKLRLAFLDMPDLAILNSGGMISISTKMDAPLVHRLSKALGTNPWQPEVAQMTLRLLAHLDDLQGVSQAFDSWLAIFRSCVLSSLRRAVDEHLSQQDAGIEPAEFALKIEPTNEVAARHLMRFQWRLGHATRAIEIYDSLYAVLDEDYDQEPEPATMSLLASIKLDPAGGNNSVPAAAKRPQPRIYVLLERSPGEASAETSSMAAALHADLRMRLSRFREWRVVGTDDIADAILRMRLLRLSGKLVLSLEFFRSSTEELLWSEMVHQPESSWAEKVRLILIHIAQAFSVAISDRPLSGLDSDIYDRWLQAQALLQEWSPSAERKMLRLLEDITVEAPCFGAAHAELAGVLNVRHIFLPGTRQTDDIKQRALLHAIEAVSLDPLDTRAHRVLAWCYCHNSEFPLAEFHFEQALSLNQNNMLTLASCALGFAFIDQTKRADELIGQMTSVQQEIDPYLSIYLAATMYLCGDFARACLSCEGGEKLMPTVGGWHAASLFKIGEPAQASRRLGRYFAHIKSLWCGPPDPDDEDIMDWFTAIFPFRNEAVRQDLMATLKQVSNNAVDFSAAGQVCKVREPFSNAVQTIAHGDF